MQLTKISIEFTAEELEAIHYAISLGVRNYQKSNPKIADDWIEYGKDK